MFLQVLLVLIAVAPAVAAALAGIGTALGLFVWSEWIQVAWCLELRTKWVLGALFWVQFACWYVYPVHASVLGQCGMDVICSLTRLTPT